MVCVIKHACKNVSSASVNKSVMDGMTMSDKYDVKRQLFKGYYSTSTQKNIQMRCCAEYSYSERKTFLANIKQESLADAKQINDTVCDFLLMVDSNRGRITYGLRDIFVCRGWKSPFSPTVFWL